MKRAAAIWLMLCVAAEAQFTGFPLAENTNAWNWPEAVSRYNPIGQLYSAIVERCIAAGVAQPSIVEDWTVYNGWSLTIGAGYTNRVDLTKTVRTTNQFTPFVSTWTNAYGHGTVTNHPWITPAVLDGLDNALLTALPHFVCTNWAGPTNSAGPMVTFSNWFGRTNTSGVHPDSFPLESKAGLFSRHSIGGGYKLTTNAWGHVSAGTAHFQRSVGATQLWPLRQARWSGAAWSSLNIGHIDFRTYSAVKPVIRYIPAGTNPLTGTLTFNCEGYYVKMTPGVAGDQYVYYAGEMVEVGTNDVPLTRQWWSLSYLRGYDAAPNTNDCVIVTYTNALDLYGGNETVSIYPAQAYINETGLHAKMLDDRWRILRALVWTADDAAWDFPSGASNQSYGAEDVGVVWTSLTATLDTQYHLTNATAVAPPRQGSHGDQGYAVLTAGLEGYRRSAKWTCPTTNIAHGLAFYAYAQPFPRWESGLLDTQNVWNAYGQNVSNYGWRVIDQFGECNDEQFESCAIGSTNRPTPPWCAAPIPTRQEPSFGYIVPTVKAFVRWDGTNGFRYR